MRPVTPDEGCVAGTLHHLEIAVPDLAQALDFWAWFLTQLGYRPKHEWRDGSSYQRGEFYVVLREADVADVEPPFREGRAGLHHIAFHATSRDAVDSLTDAVRAHGYQVLFEDRHPFAGGPEHYALYFREPDGIKIEVVAPH